MSAVETSEADMWRGRLVSSALQNYFSDTGDKLDPDKVARISQTYALSSSPYYESDYLSFLGSKLNLPDVNFNLGMRTVLDVMMKPIGNQIQVNVTQSSSRTPIQALVKMYVFDGTSVVGIYLGETAISGYLNFDISISTISSDIVIAFASSGPSVGYAVIDGRGTPLSPSQNKGYVYSGQLQNNAFPNKSIFAMEDWTTLQNNLIQTGSFSLPILILWKTGNTYSFIQYPHFPSNYGAPLPSVQRREYRIVTIVRLGNSTFVWDIRAWRG